MWGSKSGPQDQVTRSTESARCPKFFILKLDCFQVLSYPPGKEHILKGIISFNVPTAYYLLLMEETEA